MRSDAPALYADHDEREHPKPAYGYYFKLLDVGVTYKWTSYHKALTIYNLPSSIEADGTATFSPVQIQHGPLDAAADYQSKSFQISVSITEDLIKAFAVSAAATKVRVWVIRLNGAALTLAGSAQLDYSQDGLIVGGGLLGQMILSTVTATAVVTPEIFYVDSQIPRHYFQALCNHVLYDPYTCKASKNSDGSNVNNANPWQKSFDIDWSAGNNHYQNGYLTTSDGGKFHITSNNGSKIYLAYWSPAIANGEWVTLYKGCNHTTLDCNNKFGNLANFGGFPFIPDQNPIYHGV